MLNFAANSRNSFQYDNYIIDRDVPRNWHCNVRLLPLLCQNIQ